MSFEEKIGKKFFAIKKEKIEKNKKKDKKLLKDSSYISPKELLFKDKNLQEKLKAIDDKKNFQNLIMAHPSENSLKENLPSLNSQENNNLISKKEKIIIIRALISFGEENNLIPNIQTFEKKQLNYSKNANESKLQNEISTAINLLIIKYFNENMLEPDYKLLDVLKEKFTNIEIFVFKSLITSIMNFILDWAINIENLDSFFENDYNNPSDSEKFVIIFEKFNQMMNVCQKIEKNFNIIFEKIKKEIEFEFTLIELFTDLFWDFIFRIHQLNCKFGSVYFDGTLDKKIKIILENIVNILFNIKTPLKKKIGESINLTWILKEKIYLANYILNLKIKNNIYNFEIKPKITLPLPAPIPIINLRESFNGIKPPEAIKQEIYIKEDNKIEENKLEDNKIKENKLEENKNEENQNKTEENEENKIEINKVEENDIEENDIEENIIEEIVDNKVKGDIINNENNNIEYKKENNIIVGNINTKDEEIQTNINENNIIESNKISLDELYDSIMNINDSENNNKSKKKNKKKKKKKNNNIIQNEESFSDNDPIVDKFKSELNSFNSNGNQKIKPKFSINWLKSINLTID